MQASIVFFMADIKSLDKIASKWSEVTPQRAGEYQSGVQSPKKSWSQATGDAAENYNAGVSEAISRGAFAKGVSAAGDSAWQKGALEKGVSRWPQGVRLGKSKYNQGFAPYHAAISSVTLSPRGPKGDPRNYDRVREIGEALHETKVGR